MMCKFIELGEIDTEICSIEFKKGDASYNTTLLSQQSKNLRINACILNDIHLLIGVEADNLIYLDFAGRSAYIAQIFKFNNKYTGSKIGDIVMTKNLLEMDVLRRTIFTKNYIRTILRAPIWEAARPSRVNQTIALLNLYKWKTNLLVKLSNYVSLANVQQQNQYALADISQPLIRSPPRSPRRIIKPANVYMSPSKVTKRNKSVFDLDD